MDHDGKTFRNCRVRLDDNAYRGCFFEDVVFEYGGGDFLFAENTVHGWRIVIDGDLARGLGALRQFAHAGGGKAVKMIVDQLAIEMRRSGPLETFEIR